MPVPNTLTRIINKKGSLVKFSISKIQNAITKTIIDVENTTSWEAKERSIKYADLVKENIYKNFYNLDYLTAFFSRILLTFDKEEREERISRVEFGGRFNNLLLLHFLAEEKKEMVEKNNSSKMKEFCKRVFKKFIKDSSVLDLTCTVFSKRMFDKMNQGFTDEDQYPCRDFIQDQIESTLKEIGEVMIAEGFMIFREGKRKISEGEISKAQFTHNGIHSDRVRKTLMWNIKHECDTIFGLNDWVVGRGGKSFKELMEISDQRFYNDVKEVVNGIMLRVDEVKVVIIAGPSCSNKTTTTTIIENELAKNGLRLKQLNIDDYFYNLSEHPKDEFGDYDFEMPEAIDIPLLNSNLRDLINGETIKKPNYNFKLGKRDSYSDFKVEKDEIILIDCLHGLFQKLTSAIPPQKKFKIYTESANMLRNSNGAYTMWTDVRVLKRMIRDSLYRSYQPQKTLEHWVYVRKGELKHIIPYIYSVDAVLNSGTPYEIPILKTVLQDKMPNSEHLKDLRLHGRFDAYIRGIRLQSLLDTVIGHEQISDVDIYSPLREFIGGSGYDIAHND